MAPDMLVLSAYFALFALVGVLAALENRQMLRGSQTISAFVHQHVFGVFFLAVWMAVGIGMLAGHFMSGPVYCG